jgi:hypothetical protein
MAASKYNFAIEQGSSFKLSIKYKDREDNIIPFTGYCARLIWKTNSNVIQTFHSDDAANSNYKFYIDKPNGIITLMLSATYTNSLDFSSAKYDLEIQSSQDLYTNGGKYTIRLIYGSINIIPRFSQTTNTLVC